MLDPALEELIRLLARAAVRKGLVRPDEAPQPQPKDADPPAPPLPRSTP